MIIKERYQITIDKDLAEWIKTNFINLSGWINAVARKEMNTQTTPNVYDKSKNVYDKSNVDKEFNEVFNDKEEVR